MKTYMCDLCGEPNITPMTERDIPVTEPHDHEGSKDTLVVRAEIRIQHSDPYNGAKNTHADVCRGCFHKLLREAATDRVSV